MNHVPVFEPEDKTPLKRRGVTVITQHGRAVSFGMSRDRTASYLKKMAQHENHELMAAMLEHKAAGLKTRSSAGVRPA